MFDGDYNYRRIEFTASEIQHVTTVCDYVLCIWNNQHLNCVVTVLMGNDYYSHATGYVASSSFLERVCNLVKEVRDHNPAVKYGMYMKCL